MSTRHLTPSEKEQLERIIDRTSLHQVLFALSGICHDKANHLLENWQDEQMARLFVRHGLLIEKRAECARIDGL